MYVTSDGDSVYDVTSQRTSNGYVFITQYEGRIQLTVGFPAPTHEGNQYIAWQGRFLLTAPEEQQLVSDTPLALNPTAYFTSDDTYPAGTEVAIKVLDPDGVEITNEDGGGDWVLAHALDAEGSAGLYDTGRYDFVHPANRVEAEKALFQNWYYPQEPDLSYPPRWPFLGTPFWVRVIVPPDSPEPQEPTIPELVEVPPLDARASGRSLRFY